MAVRLELTVATEWMRKAQVFGPEPTGPKEWMHKNG